MTTHRSRSLILVANACMGICKVTNPSMEPFNTQTKTLLAALLVGLCENVGTALTYGQLAYMYIESVHDALISSCSLWESDSAPQMCTACMHVWVCSSLRKDICLTSSTESGMLTLYSFSNIIIICCFRFVDLVVFRSPVPDNFSLLCTESKSTTSMTIGNTLLDHVLRYQSASAVGSRNITACVK